MRCGPQEVVVLVGRRPSLFGRVLEGRNAVEFEAPAVRSDVRIDPRERAHRSASPSDVAVSTHDRNGADFRLRPERTLVVSGQEIGTRYRSDEEAPERASARAWDGG